MAHKTKKITENSDLDKVLEEPGWVLAPASRTREIVQTARNSIKKRGGARLGAGRKALGRVRLYTHVEKKTLQALHTAAGGPRGVGAVIDQLVAGHSEIGGKKTTRHPVSPIGSKAKRA